ncbi:cap2 mRNA methylation [Homalodisca vitripennis]|nr:cap2 mRNA methylation [Homalodisca vitripennis]
MLKMFTLLECDSICLIYLLVCVFESVSVFKPVKSKEGNSEVYVLCGNYFGKHHFDPWMPSLLKMFAGVLSELSHSRHQVRMAVWSKALLLDTGGSLGVAGSTLMSDVMEFCSLVYTYENH